MKDFEKAELVSDYHKDFYGVRPDNLRNMSFEERVALYNRITKEHEAMQKTPEGRALLTQRGWSLPPE
jgi:uncharacterized protein YbcI